MKTAISLPDDIFEAAEGLAEELGVSRSRLYSKAIAEFVAHHRDDNVTARLNAVYSDAPASLDPLLEDLQSLSIPRGEW